MLNTTSNMSALEWFFRRPPASNFPQNISSPELRQLSAAVDKLALNLNTLVATNTLPEFSDYALFCSKWVGAINNSDRVDRSNIDELIHNLEGVITKVKALNPPNLSQDVVASLKETVIALVIVAKASEDVGFRTEVIALAKSLPQS